MMEQVHDTPYTDIRERQFVTRKVKFIYFIVAVLSMVGLASASLAMAQNQTVLATALFVVTFIVIGAAFVVKARIRRAAGTKA